MTVSSAKSALSATPGENQGQRTARRAAEARSARGLATARAAAQAQQNAYLRLLNQRAAEAKAAGPKLEVARGVVLNTRTKEVTMPKRCRTPRAYKPATTHLPPPREPQRRRRRTAVTDDIPTRVK